MTEFHCLSGAEDVRAAGNNMRNAAEEMGRVAMNLDQLFQQHQRFLSDWLSQFEQILAEYKK